MAATRIREQDAHIIALSEAVIRSSRELLESSEAALPRHLIVAQEDHASPAEREDEPVGRSPAAHGPSPSQSR